MRLKKIDAKVDIEKRPLVDSKKLVEKLREKGPETKEKGFEKPEGNPRKGPVKSPEVTGKRLEATEKPHEKPLKEVVAALPSPPAHQPYQP